MSELPVYEVKKVPVGSILIDGVLDDPGWSMVEPMRAFTLSNGSGPAERQTTVRMCCDDENLYVAFECGDPDIWGTMFNRDDPIYEEEVVEAFIDPDSDQVTYYELQTSPYGTLFDAVIINPLGDRGFTSDASWTCEGWQSAVQVDGTLDNRDDIDKSWTVEWAIPFASLPGAPNIPPKNGDTWRINFYRIDATPTPEFSCWSPTLTPSPNFHVPSMFGSITFRE